MRSRVASFQLLIALKIKCILEISDERGDLRILERKKEREKERVRVRARDMRHSGKGRIYG